MSHPYGKPIGRAARVRSGQKILSILVNEEHLNAVKDALDKAKSKLTCRISIKISTDIESIGTLPKRVKKRMEEKKAEEEKAAEEEKDKAEKKDEKGKGKDEGKGKEEKKDEKKEEKKDEKAKDAKKKK
jgi:Mg-chelatase subunit ChlI